MAVEQAVILVLLLHLLKLMVDEIELEHPVFAILFQEVIVSCTCSSVVIVTLVLVICIGDYTGMIQLTYHVFATLGLQFHQVSWLIITYIRYSTKI